VSKREQNSSVARRVLSSRWVGAWRVRPGVSGRILGCWTGSQEASGAELEDNLEQPDSPAKDMPEGVPKVLWSEIGGNEEIKSKCANGVE
jgi:hypothetical protein